MRDAMWSRRRLLKGAFFGAAALFGGWPALASAEDEGLPEATLSLYNIHSRERARVTFRDMFGGYQPKALGTINNLLRCHFTGRVAKIDLKVIEYLNLVDKRLGGGHEVHIISGFRAPQYNALLESKGHRVARHSLHTKGKAIDIIIPGISLASLQECALGLQYGGVGYYPTDGFLHIDSGGFRTWFGG